MRKIDGIKGVTIGGINVNNFRYADDTVLIAETEDDLQNLINAVNNAGVEFGMKMNVKKTKSMVVSRENIPSCLMELWSNKSINLSI